MYSPHALPDNFHSLPIWLKEAYHKDPTIQRIVKDWRMSHQDEIQLWKKLAIAMYELKNTWEATAQAQQSHTSKLLEHHNL